MFWIGNCNGAKEGSSPFETTSAGLKRLLVDSNPARQEARSCLADANYVALCIICSVVELNRPTTTEFQC